jgi:hypothetical protein
MRLSALAALRRDREQAWYLPTSVLSALLYSLMSAHLLMSAYLYDVCSSVFCLLCRMTSAYLWRLSSCDVCLLVCLPELRLPICVITAQLNDVCIFVWYLPTCCMSGFVASAYLCYVCLNYVFLFVLWMLNWMTSAYLYNACLLVHSMSGFLYQHMVSCYLYNLISCCLNKICMPVWFLPPCRMSGYFTNVAWLPVLCRATCMTSAYL